MENTVVSLKKVQNELYNLMMIVDSFCESNEIEYSLSGGSLLGAIRHQGFIPWDDDLDIMLTRENYEKFKNCFRTNPPENCILERDQWVFRVRRTHKEKGYIPSIDLFILDKAPTNMLKGKMQILLLRILQGLLRNNEKEGKYSLVYEFLIVVSEALGKLANKERLFEAYDRISQWGRNESGYKLAIFDDRFNLIGLRYDASLISGYIKHKFNNSEFKIIDKYDDYLKIQFGDYMRLPPEEDRVPQHIF